MPTQRLFAAALLLLGASSCDSNEVHTGEPDSGSDSGRAIEDAGSDAGLIDASAEDGGAPDAASPLPVAPTPEDVPDIVAQINALAPGHAMYLPTVTVHPPAGYEDHDWFRYGPGGRDFCNQMAYAPDRQSALYAGANHGSPHRLNDVWEYHLGSNTWQALYGPTGGNFNSRVAQKRLVQRLIAGEELTDAELSETEEYRTWWRDNVMLHPEGYLSVNDPGHGPLEPWHTWDTLNYDPVNRRLMWPFAAAQPFGMSLHQWAWDLPERPTRGENLTKMVYFDLDSNRWELYRDQVGAPPVESNAALSIIHVGGTRFVYATAHWRGGTGMFLWDAGTGVWTRIRPNDGASLESLAEDGAFPQPDGLGEYSPTHDAILYVGQGVYISRAPRARLYRFETNEWTATAPPPVQASDSDSALVYAEAADRFVLVHPGHDATRVYEYDVSTESWQTRAFDGPALRSEPAFGYYDPRFGVVVMQPRRGSRVWVYRP